MEVHVITSDISKAKREKILSYIYSNKTSKHIIISSYQLVSNMIDNFIYNIPGYKNVSFTYDYVILDEGHIIKNPSTKLYKAMQL